MKKSYLVILASVATILVTFSGAWLYGSYSIKKKFKENESLKTENISITGFPFSYKIDIDNASLMNKKNDIFSFKKVAINLSLINRSLNLKLLDEIAIKLNLNNKEVAMYYRCNVPNTIDFKYKNHLWFTEKTPQITNFSYIDKDCKILDSNNKELLRLDNYIIKVDINSEKTLFSINSSGFKDYILNNFKIGDFNLNIKADLIKKTMTKDDVTKDDIAKQKQGLIMLAGEKMESLKLEGSLDSDLKFSTNLDMSLIKDGYKGNAVVAITPIDNITNYLIKELGFNKDILLKILELIASKDGGTTKFDIEFTPKDGLVIGKISLNDLVKKYFYLSQAEIPKPVN